MDFENLKKNGYVLILKIKIQKMVEKLKKLKTRIKIKWNSK